jgi:hypothetical protein
VKPNIAKATLGYNPMLQKQYWVATQRCKSNIGLQPNVAKATLGYNPMLQKQYWVATQRCKSNIGLQPNIEKAALGYNPMYPTLQKRHWATNPTLQRKTHMLQPNVAL